MGGHATETTRPGKGTWRGLAMFNKMVRKESFPEKGVVEPKPEDEDRRKRVEQAGVCGSSGKPLWREQLGMSGLGSGWRPAERRQPGVTWRFKSPQLLQLPQRLWETEQDED